MEIREVLAAYSTLCGIKVDFAEDRLWCVIESAGDEMSLCRRIHRSKRCIELCIQSDKEGFRKAAQSADAYVPTCPFGLGEIIVPVMSEGRCAGFLIAGAFMRTDDDGREILTKTLSQDPGLESDALREDIANIPRFSEEQIEARVRMLKAAAAYIGRELPLLGAHRSTGQRVREYINKNLGSSITLCDMSKSLHCSTVTLTQAFKREFGVTIMSYVATRRVELAKELLRTTDMPVLEVALHCGFSDGEYFCRSFKRLCGMTPGAYRRSVI